MTEGARNAVFTNIVVVSLALLLSCCTNDRETKILLGILDTHGDVFSAVQKPHRQRWFMPVMLV
jgi:hypothetical protein